jgi:4-amino-4-deoxy-L-arabinose transferase-like glycosyltransferase
VPCPRLRDGCDLTLNVLKYAPGWLFLLALAIRCAIIAIENFDGLYGQDAFAYLECARLLLQTPSAALHPGLCYWPLGYPALEALFIVATGANPFGAQLASLLAGAALAPLVYWLVLESEPVDTRAGPDVTAATRQAAVAAGLITAVCGQLVLSSVVVMSDAPALFWATLCACMLLHWGNRGAGEPRRILWLIGAALALAIAVCTRWIYGGLLLPFGTFVVATLWRSATPERIVPLALAALVFCLIVLPQLLLSQHSIAPALGHAWVKGWNPVNAVRRSFDNPDGHFHYPLPPALFYAAPLYHPTFLAPLLTPFVVFGARHWLQSRVLLLLGGWTLTLYLYLSGIPYENGRFSLAYFPPIAVLAAAGLLLRPALPHTSWNAPRVSWLLLGISLCISLSFVYRNAVKLNTLKAREISAVRYLESQLPPEAMVLTFELTASIRAYTPADVVDIFAQTPATLRTLVCGARASYLYVEKDVIESQWLGRAPSNNFHWLRDALGLQPIGTHATWTLYRVGSCR